MKHILTVLCASLILFSCGNDKKEQSEKSASSGIPEVDRLTRLIEKRPTDDQLYFQRAEVYYNNGLYDLSARDADRAIDLDSTRWEYHHLMADALLDNARSRESLRALEYYLQINPQRVPTWLKLTEFQYILKQYDDALRSINKIVEIDPQESEAYFMLGKVLLDKGDQDKALNAFQTATEMDSGNTEAWLSMGNMLTDQENPQALRYIENGLAIHPEHIPLLQSKGYALQKFGRMNDALAVFDKITSLETKNPEGHFNKGVVYLKMDSLDNAEKSFEIAQKLDPTNYLFYLNRGYVLERLNKLQQALEQYEQAEKLNSTKDERVLESIALLKAKINDQ
jgi:tetratricopeptide (TPR) repeat protein